MPDLPCKECGSINKIPEAWLKPRHPRSNRHSNKFFAVIDAAYYHWPADAEPFPENEDHLRAYLLCQAGHCDIVGQNLLDEADAVRAADFVGRILGKVRRGGGYAFVEPSGRSSLLAKIPRTINHRVVDQKEFNPISQKVFEIICAVTRHSDIDELVRTAPHRNESEAAA